MGFAQPETISNANDIANNFAILKHYPFFEIAGNPSFDFFAETLSSAGKSTKYGYDTKLSWVNRVPRLENGDWRA